MNYRSKNELNLALHTTTVIPIGSYLCIKFGTIFVVSLEREHSSMY